MAVNFDWRGTCVSWAAEKAFRGVSLLRVNTAASRINSAASPSRQWIGKKACVFSVSCLGSWERTWRRLSLFDQKSSSCFVVYLPTNHSIKDYKNLSHLPFSQKITLLDFVVLISVQLLLNMRAVYTKLFLLYQFSFIMATNFFFLNVAP